MIKFKKVSAKNFFAIGNQPITIQLDKSPTTVITGGNGSGKCVLPNTPIRVKNTKTGEIIETTIGELYAKYDKTGGSN